MAESLKTIKELATIAFTLLGVLFGMIIMTFIFTQLGPSAAGLEDGTTNVINATDVHVNETLFTISEASDPNFNGGVIIIRAINGSGGQVILPGNWTLDATAGTLINATARVWGYVNMTYSFKYKTPEILRTEDVQNNSLQAIVTYSEGADTQFNTLSITIILVLLIAVFLIFWKIFVSQKGKKSDRGAGNFS